MMKYSREPCKPDSYAVARENTFCAGTKPFDLQRANVFQMSRSDTTVAVQLISKLFVAHEE